MYYVPLNRNVSKVIVHPEPFSSKTMKQSLNGPEVMPAGHVKYADREFSDTEVEALMGYFRLTTYKALRSVLGFMRKSGSSSSQD